MRREGARSRASPPIPVPLQILDAFDPDRLGRLPDLAGTQGHVSPLDRRTARVATHGEGVDAASPPVAESPGEALEWAASGCQRSPATFAWAAGEAHEAAPSSSRKERSSRTRRAPLSPSNSVAYSSAIR